MYVRSGIDRKKKAASSRGRGVGGVFKKLIGKVTKKAIGRTAKSALKTLTKKKTVGAIVRLGKQTLQRNPRLKKTIVKQSKKVVADVAKNILGPSSEKKSGPAKKKIDINSRQKRIAAAASVPAKKVKKIKDTVRPLGVAKKKKAAARKKKKSGIPLKGWRKLTVGDGVILE